MRHIGTLDCEVVIVGAGPVGMALALELAAHGCRVIVIERRPQLSHEGSRAINLAAHALRFLNRIGATELVAEGTTLTSARTCYGNREILARTIAPPAPGLLPAFVNIAQSRTEEILLRRVEEAAGVEVFWNSQVTGFTPGPDGVRVALLGDDNPTIRCAYLVGCDGARSAVRDLLGLGFPGRSYPDRFLIADIRAELPFPNERRFYFHPPFNPGRQVLIHPQPDDVWRIDWQVPDDVDHAEELASGRLSERIHAVIGDVPFEVRWLSSYRFQQRLAPRFRVGRVFLAGDAAHLMSPFGGRGLNSGLEDAANLGWKLGQVLAGRAPQSLLETYSSERRLAAVRNLQVTGATMRFLLPEGQARRAVRDLVLTGSTRLRPLRRLVDSGRLAEPVRYAARPDRPRWLSGQSRANALPQPGEYAPDVVVKLAGDSAPLGLQALRGRRPCVLVVPPPHARPPEPTELEALREGAETVWVADLPEALATAQVRGVSDPSGELRRVYGARNRFAGYLLRPDGYIAARAISDRWAPMWGAVPEETTMTRRDEDHRDSTRT